MDWNRIIAFADRHQGGVSKRQEGADPSDVEILNTIAHGRLPDDYIEFLRRMGVESMELPLLDPQRCSIDVVLAWHRKEVFLCGWPVA